MSGGRLIGVDVGTQGTKAAIFSASGECLAEAYKESALRNPGPGRVEEDPDDQLAAVCAVIRACLEKSNTRPTDVDGLAIDGQMAGIIGIGADGRHVTPYDSWLDTRCAPYIRKMSASAGVEVLRKTGAIPSFNHGPKILWWKSERPDSYRSIRAFVQPASYVAMRLCGLGAESAFIDETYLHFSGFADNEKLRWDGDLCREFSVDTSKLPPIVKPTDIIGRISHGGAERTGLREGTPVAAGCGDTAASFLACGATEVGLCVDVAGTASVFAATTDDLRADEDDSIVACGRSATPGLWHPYAYINGGGLNMEWFRKNIAVPTPAAPTDDIYNTFNELVARLPFEESDPYFVPHFGGRVMPSAPHLRGAWAGLGWEHSIGHLYRAMLDGVAHEYGIYLAKIRELYPSLTLGEVRVTGGGAVNGLWNRIKAAVCQLPVLSVVGSVGAPLGSAIVAGVAVGVLGSFPEAAEAWVRTGAKTLVDEKLSKHYALRQHRYEDLVARLAAFSEL